MQQLFSYFDFLKSQADLLCPNYSNLDCNYDLNVVCTENPVNLHYSVMLRRWTNLTVNLCFRST